MISFPDCGWTCGLWPFLLLTEASNNPTHQKERLHQHILGLIFLPHILSHLLLIHKLSRMKSIVVLRICSRELGLYNVSCFNISQANLYVWGTFLLAIPPCGKGVFTEPFIFKCLAQKGWRSKGKRVITGAMAAVKMFPKCLWKGNGLWKGLQQYNVMPR